MSDNTALIPIHLDSLFIPSGSSMEVAAPAVDFTRLDDPTQAYLGESLTATPMSTIQLEPGVHLHWALPDALTKTMSRPIIRKHAFQIAFGNADGNAIWEVMLIAKWLQATSKDTAKLLPKETRGAIGVPPEGIAVINRLLDNSAFPAVPNRWQITRFSGNGIPEKQWMVESDYVWPDKNPPQKVRYTPYPKAGSAGLDYCFIGRWYELNSKPPSGAYLPYPLTAVGYGEPTFAALYPNCRSVFGFCDTERQSLNAPCTYSIRGFYSDPALDHYAVFVADFLKNPPAEYPYLNLLNALKDEFQWFFPIRIKKDDPKFSADQLILMNACGWLDPDKSNSGQRLNKGEKIEVAGNGYLMLQSDGNLVLCDAANNTKWATMTSGRVVTHVIMQPDGNLVIYNGTAPVWASDTWNVGAAGGYLEIDLLTFKVEIKKPDGSVVKQLAPGQAPILRMNSNQRLNKGEKMEVAGKGYLMLQSDGNLVLCDAANNTQWATMTSGRAVTHVIMQFDGNLVIYNGTAPIWASDTWNVGASGGYLEIDLLTFKVEIKKPGGLVVKQLKSPQQPTVGTSPILRMRSKSDDFILSTAASDPGNTLGAGNEAAEKVIRNTLETLIQEQLPTQMACFAWCTARAGSTTQPAIKDIALAMGATGSEAMSAFLANKISPSKKALVEDYLEAHQLSARLEHQQIDLGPKFEEARHEKGFVAVPGGTIWAVRPQSATPQQADAKEAAKAITSVTLPDGLANILHELNALQQQLDQTNFQIEALQQQIFADWCRYLTEENDLKNVVNPGAFSNQYDSGFVNQYSSGFTNEDNETVATHSAETLGNMRAYIEWQIDVASKQLKQDAADLPQKVKAKHQQLTVGLAGLPPGQNYIVQPTAAPRYWQPAEPTLLVTGLKPSPRHGQDGRLRDDQLLGCLIGIDANPEDFALQSTQNDWHPVLMDWAVSFTQAKNNYTGDPDDYCYLPSYLEDNYTLQTVDFPPAPKTFSPRTAIPFSGRSILTPSGSMLQKQAIIRNLIPNILEKMPKNASHDQVEFKKWVKTIDPVLSASANAAGYNPGSDPDIIRQWISARLTNTPDGKLPGLVSWYWTQVVIDKKDDVDTFVAWASERMQLKAAYFKKYNIPAANQGDFYLQNDQNFIPWLKTELGAAWAAFFTDRNIADAAAQTQYATQNFNALLNWYQAQVRDSLHTVMDYHAYRNIAGVHGLSQALSGFNKSLVALSQTYQLDIAHPRATDDPSKAFATKVREAVQGQNRYSPLPDGDFSPIRAGKMSIDRVHLINNFGQYWPALGDNLAKSASLVCANAMTLTPGSREIALTPRLAEPARLNFRWLSSAHNDLPDIAQDKDLVEMNSHPASNPICGWFLPNNLDVSLMVYGQKGQAYGYIEQGGNWRVFPGHDGPVLPQEIENPHLRNIVQRICQTGKSQAGFLRDLIAVLDTALDSIAPDNSDQHDALSLLMGRPIALVRAAISLEHKGVDPIHQSQHIFLDDLGRFADAQKAGTAGTFERNTFGVDKVKIPLRLGEFRQRNDGLVGYWIDQAPAGALPAGTKPGDTFFAPQSFDPKKNKRPGHILTHDADGAAFQIDLTLADTDRLEISMLIDPRGKVHATCGLLPVKNIHLPPDQYKAALNNIEIAFLSAPILTLPERLHLSVPREPGYGWSWIAREDTHWKIVNSVGALQPVDVERAFPEVASVVWDLLITSGWIEETTDGNARVVPKDQRPASGLDDQYAAILPKIEDMLERTRINPFDATAAFSGTPVIREGWLKLTKTK